MAKNSVVQKDDSLKISNIKLANKNVFQLQ